MIDRDQWTFDGLVAGPVATLLAGAQQHVFYGSLEGNVHHVWWDPATGMRNADQWTSDGHVLSELAMLLSG